MMFRFSVWFRAGLPFIGLCAGLLFCFVERAAAVTAELWLGAVDRSSGGLSRVDASPTSDGVTVPDKVAGFDCRRTAPSRHPSGAGMMRCIYFLVSNPSFRPHCFITVTFFDEGIPWSLEYDSTDASVRKVPQAPGAFKTIGFYPGYGTRKWETVSFEIHDARFSRRCNGGDFRIGAPPGSALAVRFVSISTERPEKMSTVQDAASKLPRVKAGRGMEVTFGASNFPPGTSAAEVQSFFVNAMADIFAPSGVTSWETYVRWSALEPERGRWDYSLYDAEIAELKKRGLKWVPFLIAGPAYTTPAWFDKSLESVHYRCLEHDTESGVQSLWNPNLRSHIREFLRRFAEHYLPTGMIESILLGITGDFGEAIYPVSGGGWTGDYHQHSGYWCGDRYARASFRSFLHRKYGSVDALNRAWKTNFSSIDQIQPFLPENAPSIRAWLDFMAWYRGSMDEWADWWVATAREFFPNTKIYLCTGGDGYPTHGSDFTHQARIAAKYKAGVRITNEGSDYPTNFWLTRWVASACKHYKTFYGFEPAAGVDEHGLVVRIYNVAASGADQLFEYSGNMTGSLQRREAFRQHIGLLSKGKPVVDTAVYIPKTHITAHPREWQTPFVEAGRIRDALDLDFVDAEMVAEGALRRYRFLILVHGTLYEKAELENLLKWVKSGGVLISPNLGKPTTPENDPDPDGDLRLSEPGVRRIGRGYVFVSAERPGPGFHADLARVLFRTGEVMPGVAPKVPADGEWNGVFVTQQQGRILVLNTTDKTISGILGGTKYEVKPHSMAVVKVLAD